MSVLRFTLGLNVTDRVYDMDVLDFVPAVDNLLATDEPGQFDVEGGSDVAMLVILAEYLGAFEVVGTGSKTNDVVTFAFSPMYDGSSTFTSGAAPWQPNFAYNVNDVVNHVGNLYICTVGGTSDGPGNGPTGTGTNIVDDGVRWDYVSPEIVHNGARFVVLRDGNWPTDQVDFSVLATTSDGFELSEDWSWLTTPSGYGLGDVSPTLAVTILPGEGAPEETNIVIDIVDLVRGVDIDTIDIQIGGAPAYVSSAFQSGFEGPESAIIGIAGGFRVTIDREADYTPGETVSVSVTAKAPA